MPDQTRFSDFVQRVKRLRYFSQCLPVASANQGSPVSGSSIGTVVESTSSFGPTASTLALRLRKRSHSCPNLLQLDSNGDQRVAIVAEGDGKEEPSTSSSGVTAQQQSTASQTDQDLWPPTPYEHLFFSVLPPSLLFPPPPAPAEASPRQLAPSELLDRYIDAAFRNHERSTTLLGKPNATEDVSLLKGWFTSAVTLFSRYGVKGKEQSKQTKRVPRFLFLAGNWFFFVTIDKASKRVRKREKNQI